MTEAEVARAAAPIFVGVLLRRRARLAARTPLASDPGACPPAAGSVPSAVRARSLRPQRKAPRAAQTTP